MSDRIEITFVTSSSFKREENRALVESCRMPDGTPVRDIFNFNMVDNSIKEPLDVSLEEMVRHEAKAAYSRLKRPCVVEHAGLVFEDYLKDCYPGGLTKPMWNTLGRNFLDETHSAGRPARAVAAVGYCDGQKVQTFVGETIGKLSNEPRGDRAFYWDTVFVPKDSNEEGLTYAEIVSKYSISHKMIEHSQSAKAMIAFLAWRRENEPELWKANY